MHPLADKVANEQEGHQGQHPPHQNGGEQSGLSIDAVDIAAVLIDPLDHLGIAVDGGSLVDLLLSLVGKGDLIPFDLHQTDVVLIGHGHEGGVAHLLDLFFQHGREKCHVQYH